MIVMATAVLTVVTTDSLRQGRASYRHHKDICKLKEALTKNPSDLCLLSWLKGEASLHVSTSTVQSDAKLDLALLKDIQDYRHGKRLEPFRLILDVPVTIEPKSSTARQEILDQVGADLVLDGKLCDIAVVAIAVPTCVQCRHCPTMVLADDKIWKGDVSSRDSFDSFRGRHFDLLRIMGQGGRRVSLVAWSENFRPDVYTLPQFGLTLRYTGPRAVVVTFELPASGFLPLFVGADLSQGADRSGDRSTYGEYRLRRQDSYLRTLLLPEESRDSSAGTNSSDSDYGPYSLDSLSQADPFKGHRVDRWLVRAPEGTSVTIRARSDDLDAVLYVLDDKRVLYSDDDGPGMNSVIHFTMPEVGEVGVLAGSYHSQADGTYWLEVDRTDSLLFPATQQRPDAMLLGDSTTSYSGRVGESSVIDPIRGHRVDEWLVVKAPKETPVTIRARSDDFDAVLYALRETEVLYSDDDGPGTNSLLQFIMPESGNVGVRVGNYDSMADGRYELQIGLLHIASEPADTLTLGNKNGSDRGTGRVDGQAVVVDPHRGHRVDRWLVRAPEGTSVTIRARSDDLDAVLYVLDDKRVLYSDDDGPGMNSVIHFTMPEVGEVGVLAGSYHSQADGTYWLEVDRTDSLLFPATQQRPDAMLLGDSTTSYSGRVGESSVIDPIRGHRVDEWLVVKAPKETPVTIRARSDDFDAVLYALRETEVLYSDDDGLGMNSTNSLLQFIMPESGNVRVRVGSSDPVSEGQYLLQIDDRILDTFTTRCTVSLHPPLASGRVSCRRRKNRIGRPT